jgi:RNA:NAD 2'-phosphotransferase (TPT1/KptA family)
MSLCRKAGKEQYTREGATAAVLAINKRQPKYPVYKYKCECGSWHIATVVNTESRKRFHLKHT